MSEYTTQLRFICENLAGKDASVDANDIDTVVAKALPKIFDFKYPLFQESYRNALNTKIINHYYTREIGSETLGLWKFRLKTKLNEIMPYYNQLYESALLEFDPFKDADYFTTMDKQGSNNQTTSSTSSSDTTDTRDTSTVSSGNEIQNGNSSGSSNENSSGGYSREGSIDKAANEGITTDNDRKGTLTSNTDVSGNSSTDRLTTDRYSDTPQGGLDNVLNNVYLTNARAVTETDTASKSEGTDVTENTTQTDNGSSTRTLTDVTGTTDKDTHNDESHGTTSGTTHNEVDTSGTTTVDEDGTSKTKASSSGSLNASSTEDFIQHVYGKFPGGKTYMTLLQELRDTFINIDMMVIEELEPLFMQIW